MSNVNKLVRKMRENPKNWRIEQLETIAKHYGINVRKTGGSHVVFDHPICLELLCVPARRPIKPIYIKRFINLIELIEVTDEDF